LRPIEERRSAPLRLFVGVEGIVFSETLAVERAVVFAKACELGREGIVSKRAGSPLPERAESQLAEDEELGLCSSASRSIRAAIPEPMQHARPSHRLAWCVFD
jgi:hypothetical protein